jgi:hypothetical protein
VPRKRELIEQRGLLNLLMPHHDSAPSQWLNQRILPAATADFFNTIGQNANLPSLSYEVRSSLDSVAKVPKGTAANFPPKDENSDNRRSIAPHTRYQNRL